MADAFSVLQLVPRLDSATDGVAEYARLLAGALQTRQRIQPLFLSGDPADTATLACSQGRATSVEQRSEEALAAALRALASQERKLIVLLHYVGYGYAPRGCPVWLVRGLTRWKERDSHVRLVTVFHELYASGPPWRSSFWLSPIQRSLARRLSRLSDSAVTPLELYRRHLVRWDSAKNERILVRPVYSTVGAPARSRVWDERPRWLAVFGRAGTESRAYGKRRSALLQAARDMDAEEIVDIGPRSQTVPAELDGIRVRSTGRLPGEEVSSLLSQCRAGFLDYPSDLLPKSTIFAAYCAHGVAPVVPYDRGEGMDGLRAGTHYLLATTGKRSANAAPSSLARVSANVSAWYGGHDIASQAKDFATLLTGVELP